VSMLVLCLVMCLC